MKLLETPGLDDLGARERRLAVEGLSAALGFLRALAQSDARVQEAFAEAASLGARLARLHLELVRDGTTADATRATRAIAAALEHAREAVLAARAGTTPCGEAVAAELAAAIEGTGRGTTP